MSMLKKTKFLGKGIKTCLRQDMSQQLTMGGRSELSTGLVILQLPAQCFLTPRFLQLEQIPVTQDTQA